MTMPFHLREESQTEHDWYCFLCHCAGSVQPCPTCHRVYHEACASDATSMNISLSGWIGMTSSPAAAAPECGICCPYCNFQLEPRQMGGQFYSASIKRSWRKQIRKLLLFAKHFLRRNATWHEFAFAPIKYSATPSSSSSLACNDGVIGGVGCGGGGGGAHSHGSSSGSNSAGCCITAYQQLNCRYRRLVFQPLDTNAISQKIEAGQYRAVQHVVFDMDQLVHNVCVLFGPFSAQADRARLLLRAVRNEIWQLHLCTDCYINSRATNLAANWITKPCVPRHQLVWAKRAQPADSSLGPGAAGYWPAKLLWRNHCANGAPTTCEVCFFGGLHERATVQHEDVCAYEGASPESLCPAGKTVKYSNAFVKAQNEVKKLQELIEMEYYSYSSGETDFEISDEEDGKGGECEKEATTTKSQQSEAKQKQKDTKNNDDVNNANDEENEEEEDDDDVVIIDDAVNENIKTTKLCKKNSLTRVRRLLRELNKEPVSLKSGQVEANPADSLCLSTSNSTTGSVWGVESSRTRQKKQQGRKVTQHRKQSKLQPPQSNSTRGTSKRRGGRGRSRGGGASNLTRKRGPKNSTRTIKTMTTASTKSRRLPVRHTHSASAVSAACRSNNPNNRFSSSSDEETSPNESEEEDDEDDEDEEFDEYEEEEEEVNNEEKEEEEKERKKHIKERQVEEVVGDEEDEDDQEVIVELENTSTHENIENKSKTALNKRERTRSAVSVIKRFSDNDTDEENRHSNSSNKKLVKHSLAPILTKSNYANQPVETADTFQHSSAKKSRLTDLDVAKDSKDAHIFPSPSLIVKTEMIEPPDLSLKKRQICDLKQINRLMTITKHGGGRQNDCPPSLSRHDQQEKELQNTQLISISSTSAAGDSISASSVLSSLSSSSSSSLSAFICANKNVSGDDVSALQSKCHQMLNDQKKAFERQITDLQRLHKLKVKQLTDQIEAEKRQIAETEKIKDEQIRMAVENERAQQSRVLFRIEANHNDALEAAKKRQWCKNCLKESIYHCCWNTSYCSIPCQQQHWQSEHRQVCRRNR